MIRISSISQNFHLIVLATSLCVSLSACNTLKQKSTDKDIERMLSEMKGPEVASLDSALLDGAKQAEKAGNYSTAVQFYQQLVEKNPKNSEYQFHLAENMRRMGAYEESAIQYRKILDDKKFQLDAKEGLGLSQMALGEYDVAGDTLADVMEADTTRWRTINAIGILFTIKSMYPEARQYFAEAMVQNPKSASVRNNLGLMEALDKNYPEAIRVLQEASNLARTNNAQRKQTDLNLALVYAISGDLDKAQDSAQPHLNETQLLNNMGYYAHLADDEILAKSYLNMALTSSDKHYEKAWNNLETMNKLTKNAPRRR
ncbi:MAG: tetratricopeptide repeat protein [Alphaproteobacteria bacterium]|nr:tetratricopeptide repeat protein [Alphaproteobacteria bacterium]